MRNPLVELQGLVTPKADKTFRGKVTSVSGQKVRVRLGTGNDVDVWGTAKINDTVLITGRRITAVVGIETATTVFVP